MRRSLEKNLTASRVRARFGLTSRGNIMNLKRNRERELLALGCLRSGGSLTQAAAVAGISYFTLVRWKDRGLRADATPCEVRFTEEFKAAS